MIATVTLNPCIDSSLTIASFTRGGMNRVVHARNDAAGKGVNVSAALKGLGQDSVCLGFNYNENGYLLEDRLNDLGIRYDFVNVNGAVRTNIKLVEQDTRIMTEINQPGAYVPPEAVETLLQKIKAANADYLILSGSRPQGIASDIYARILAQNSGTVILDTEGEALLKGLSVENHKPYIIKPNLFELENAYGVKLPDRQAIAAFCRTLTENGPRMVCVSMGKDGAILVSADHAYYAKSLDIPVRGVQGAGDSMVAGMVWGLTHGAEERDLLRYAVAAASASVVLEGTQLCDAAGFAEMAERVAVEPILTGEFFMI